MKKENLLVIYCDYKNIKEAQKLIDDKVFISSIAALKWDKCPDPISVCLRCLSDDYIKYLKNK